MLRIGGVADLGHPEAGEEVAVELVVEGLDVGDVRLGVLGGEVPAFLERRSQSAEVALRPGNPQLQFMFPL